MAKLMAAWRETETCSLQHGDSSVKPLVRVDWERLASLIHPLIAVERAPKGYYWQPREQGEMALEMSDKLKFVAGFRHSPTAESLDKLKFVGHFQVCRLYLERHIPRGESIER